MKSIPDWLDERTGYRRPTKSHMTEADALERYPGAERDPASAGAGQEEATTAALFLTFRAHGRHTCGWPARSGERMTLLRCP